MFSDLGARFPGVPVEHRSVPERHVVQRIGGMDRAVAQPVTFTPFASARPCSARCVFCSETLRHVDASRLSASLRPASDYHDGLRTALADLRGLPLGVSLSGLEATDDPDWLEATVAALTDHAHAGGILTERVLYSNTAGLSRETHGARLIPLLRDFGLDRIEVSRHHFEAGPNGAIMRFRRGQAVADQNVFEETVKEASSAMHVRLVCVIQKAGIADAAAVHGYLDWAHRTLGVTDVVFRELSRLPADEYRPNTTYRTIERDRVPIEHLVDAVWPVGADPVGEFTPSRGTAGYYYRNVVLRWRNTVEVTFETSDYAVMKDAHHSDVVYKLIYHANGNLCADWDPETAVLLRTGAR
ncbi:hypothetical protein [Actinomadura sp. 9N407]|uniref:hypothetical protein n=1 Tax=Actinomadura sp. 9N407 TaxID=3375154 RepID=UPI00378CBA2C